MNLFPLLRFPFAVVGKAVDTVLAARAVVRHGEMFAAWAEPAEGLVEFEAEHEVLPGGFSWGDVAETYREALSEYCLRCGGSYTGEHTCLRDFPAGDDAVPPSAPPAGLNPPAAPDAGEGPVADSDIPPSPATGQPDLIEAIDVVLSLHAPRSFPGGIYCDSTYDQDDYCGLFTNWQSWRVHVAELIAERLGLGERRCSQCTQAAAPGEHVCWAHLNQRAAK